MGRRVVAAASSRLVPLHRRTRANHAPPRGDEEDSEALAEVRHEPQRNATTKARRHEKKDMICFVFSCLRGQRRFLSDRWVISTPWQTMLPPGRGYRTGRTGLPASTG